MIDGRRVPVFQQSDPSQVGWTDHGVSVVVEATGRFIRRAEAAAHLRGTVRRVVISANADPGDPADAPWPWGSTKRPSIPPSTRS